MRHICVRGMLFGKIPTPLNPSRAAPLNRKASVKSYFLHKDSAMVKIHHLRKSGK